MISIRKHLSSFTYLNVTQFLGALNDNIYKLLIVYFLIQMEGIERGPTILAAAGAIFVLPFLLFSAPSGTLADRYSKRNIIVWTKILEWVTMCFGVLAFFYESKWGSYSVLFLMATQSAIFGPSKYGIIPELVSTEKISKANGLMTSFTFLAIVLGTFLASFILQITGRDFVIASLFCAFIALIGIITSFNIEYTPPAGSTNRFTILFLKEIYSSIKIAKEEPSLLAALFGSAFFLFMGAFVQLNMIPFAVQTLHLSDIEGGYLFLMTAIGIGVGSILAGKISGKTVELGLVFFGGMGISLSLYCLEAFSYNLPLVIVFVIIVGCFGGLFQIPLDSFIQIASPNNYRGQIVAATNFMSFFGVLLASALMLLLNDILGLTPERGFAVLGTLTLITTMLLTYQFFDYLTRFIAMILSRLHFKVTVEGMQHLPQSPAIYLCTHTAWNDTLLLLGNQRRRIRFFIEEEKGHSKWIKKLYHLLRVVRIPPMETWEDNPTCMKAIESSLQKGISVCLLISEKDLQKKIIDLSTSSYFAKMHKKKMVPLIPVVIEKEEKKRSYRFFNCLMNRLRIPAVISFGSEIANS